jgi:hypothetical protein
LQYCAQRDNRKHKVLRFKVLNDKGTWELTIRMLCEWFGVSSDEF